MIIKGEREREREEVRKEGSLMKGQFGRLDGLIEGQNRARRFQFYNCFLSCKCINPSYQTFHFFNYFLLDFKISVEISIKLLSIIYHFPYYSEFNFIKLIHTYDNSFIILPMFHSFHLFISSKVSFE